MYYHRNKYILEQAFSTSTISPKGIVRLWSCNKAVAYAFPRKAETSNARRTADNNFWTASTVSFEAIVMKKEGT